MRRMSDSNFEAMSDQSEVFAFLARPDSYGPGCEAVEVIETHAARVFLAGDMAFKIKRAVRYPYLDFSTLAQREWACRRELRLNRRTAPRLYLDVLPIHRDDDGGLSFDDLGPVVEWAVKMRRFPAEGLFERLAETGGLSFDLCRSLAEKVAALHGSAAVVGDDEDPAALWGFPAVVAGNAAALAAHPDVFPAPAVAAFRARGEAEVEALRSLLEARDREGRVRHCHGDLHLRNICLFEGEPTLFDCLEFNDALATTDTIYDLAFLLMDFDEHGLVREANWVLNRYLETTDEAAGLRALPLFLAQRAAIRAHVAATAAAGAELSSAGRDKQAEARRYFAAAQGYLQPASPCLLAVGGLSGSGKTQLSRALAPELGATPGAVHLRSDQLRKAFCGYRELDRLPPDCYRPEVSERVYRLMRERARVLLEAGRAVVLDAVFDRVADRRAAEDLARTAGVAFAGLWLQAPQATLEARVTARRGDASDATAEVVRKQIAGLADGHPDTGAGDWESLNSDRPVAALAANARECLGGLGLALDRDHVAR